MNLKNLKIFCALVTFCFVVACEEDKSRFELNRFNLELEAGATSDYIILNSSFEWKLSESESWVTVDPSEGKAGYIRIRVSADKNNSGKKRIGILKFSSVDGKHSVSLPVSQKALEDDIATVKLAEKITLGYEENGTETVEVICGLEYDANNRLKKVVIHEDGDDTFVTNFIYESDKVISTEEYMEDGSIESCTTTYEFENGKLQRITDDEGFAGVFLYDAGEEKPMKYATNNGINYEFSWDHLGNLTQMVGITHYSDYSVQYTYSNVQDKCNVDLRAMFDFDINGVPILFDKGVFKCISSPILPNSADDTMYRYEYDSDGYVTKITILSGDEDHTFLKISYHTLIE